MGGLGHESWRLICLKGNHEDIMWHPPKSAGLRLVARQWWRRDADLLRAK